MVEMHASKMGNGDDLRLFQCKHLVRDADVRTFTEQSNSYPADALSVSLKPRRYGKKFGRNDILQFTATKL